MYSVPCVASKIAPPDLFNYEIISDGRIVSTTLSSLPEKTARITGIKEQYCNLGGHDKNGEVKLAEIKIPETVTKIGELAFATRRSLTSITIPEGVTDVGGKAFHGCTTLVSVNLPKTIKSIGMGYSFGMSR